MTALHPDIPWRAIIGMRNALIHALRWSGIGAAADVIDAIVVRTGPARAAVLVHFATSSVVPLVLIGSTRFAPNEVSSPVVSAALGSAVAVLVLLRLPRDARSAGGGPAVRPAGGRVHLRRWTVRFGPGPYLDR